MTVKRCIFLYKLTAGVVSESSDAKQRRRHILHTRGRPRPLAGHVFHGIFVQIQPTSYAQKGDYI